MTERLPVVAGSRPWRESGIALDLVILPDLLWFQGHFPDAPILPGVVQFHWALYFAGTHLGLDLPAAQQFQIKYKAMIRPGDCLVLALAPDLAKGRLDFEYFQGEQIFSTGRVFLI